MEIAIHAHPPKACVRPGGTRPGWLVIQISSPSSKKHPWIELQAARAIGPCMEIARRSRYVAVPQSILDLRKRRAAVDRVRAVGMAQPVRRNPSGNASLGRRPFDHAVDRSICERSTFAAAEHRIIDASITAKREQGPAYN